MTHRLLFGMSCGQLTVKAFLFGRPLVKLKLPCLTFTPVYL